MRSVKNGVIYSYFYFPFVDDFVNDFWSINNVQTSVDKNKITTHAQMCEIELAKEEIRAKKT